MTIQLAIYIFIVQFLAFVVKGISGFGNPLISNPLLAMKLNNNVITPGNLLMDIPVNAYIALKNRKFFNARTAVPVAICIMIGVVPGTLFLKVGSPWIIKALLGVLIIGLGVEMLTRKPTASHKENVLLRTVISVASGFMAGLFGINMLFLAYFERVSVNRQQFRSNVCFVFLMENIFRTITYLVNGIFTALSVQITLVSIPAAIAGIYVGGLLDRHIDEARAKKAIIVVFLLGGISVLVKALIWRV